MGLTFFVAWLWFDLQAIGSMLIVMGLYAVLWGKIKEVLVTDDNQMGLKGLSIDNQQEGDKHNEEGEEDLEKQLKLVDLKGNNYADHLGSKSNYWKDCQN